MDQKRRGFLKQNQNCLKLVDKYNDLAREALANEDKILSENYYQHADHFARIVEQKDVYRKQNSVQNIQETRIKETETPKLDPNNLNQSRRTFTGSGTTTAGMVCGGQFSPSPPTSAFSALTETYDGSSWTDIGSSYQWNANSNSAGWYEYTTMSGNTTAYTYYQVIGVSGNGDAGFNNCLLYTSPSPRD